MSKKREILYIFDLQNTHEQYSQCLEFITILQGHSTISTKHEKLERICQLAELINITGMWAPVCAKNYYEEPLESNGQINPPSITFAKKLMPNSIQELILEESPVSMIFHLRIHLNMAEHNQINSLSNLHYLALLLQRLDNVLKSNYGDSDVENVLKRRVSVFIVPSGGNYYPFKSEDETVDLNTYQIVSTYLRLLSKRYTGIIYGVVKKETSIAVRAIDFSRSVRLTDFFPLIPLNRMTYPKLFEETVTSDTVNAIFSLRKNERVSGANDKDPYKAFSAFIMETAYYHLKDTLLQSVVEYNSDILKVIEDEVKNIISKENICLFSFVIFMFTLCITENNNDLMQQAICQNMEFAEELTLGLRQLAQNTLQHSVCREGVFSFYLDKNVSSTSVRMILSDFNDQQTFVDNFISNLMREIEYTNNMELKQRYKELSLHKDDITLGYFFGSYGTDGPNESWVNFRKTDTSAHIGLLLFSLTMQRCGGALQLINSKAYSIQTQDIFLRYYGNACKKLPETSFISTERIIPGSHLELTVPIGAVAEQRPIGLGQMSLEQPIHETYESFAMYLDYQPSAISFDNNEFQSILKDRIQYDIDMLWDMLAIDAIVKYKIIYCWEKYWINHSNIISGGNNACVYYFDILELPNFYLDSADKIEIFIKGFINAMDILCKNCKTFFLAFTNVSDLFLNIFRQLTISLAPKKFPYNLQLYIIKTNMTESIHLLGDSFYQAISNAYNLSLEHGTQAYSVKEVNRAKALLFRNIENTQSERKMEGAVSSFPILVCPFDSILRESAEGTLSIFDKQISMLADHPMDTPPAGYKLDNIHMRLGSKIHIRAFYEMAFLFYRTNISNRIAFEILKNIMENSSYSDEYNVNLLEDDIIFYGYASYSKALLTSLQEILKEYRIQQLIQRSKVITDEVEKKKISEKIDQVPEHIAFVSYQHNLQSDFQVEDTELYFNFHNATFGEVIDKDLTRFNRPVKVIQIVPISSTLTTFNKMDARMQTTVKECNYQTPARYTVFWVTDKQSVKKDIPRKETEAKYWESVDIFYRKIYLRSDDRQDTRTVINYFIRSFSIWEDPLNCELCFPENVIAEVPLVETDQTSTVPALQLRGQSISNHVKKEDHEKNDERLIQLKSYVTYGHIRREKNHFQFYIKTQDYFSHVSIDVQDWLVDLRNKDSKQNGFMTAVLNIVFSPEHATNVGFAQYVNNYYFNGNAEIVCVNESKEYRSNFKCEHMALSKTIDDLLANTSSNEELPVRFYFADDTIITGETFHKAVSLLHSLIPIQYQYRFPTNLIQKCFLLVDRLSNESKRSYVKDVEHDFLSYVHIDVSNMRVQGDSCVGCKLEINAQKLLKRSATRNIAKYWSDKAQSYSISGYTALQQNDDVAFNKMILSHITQNVIFYDNSHFELGNIYDSILTVFAKIISEETMLGTSFKYDLLMLELKRNNDLELLKDFLKLISRPFFSFDFKVKLQVLTLLLIFSEFIVSEGTFHLQEVEECVALKESPYKSFLFENKRISETFRLLETVKKKYLCTKEQQINFFMDCLLDCLVELRSTYMMRKTTIIKFFHFLLKDKSNEKKKFQEHELSGDFWEEYVSGIHQILDCNSDETRSTWLEHLLISGEEYRDFIKKYTNSSKSLSFEPHMLFEALTVGYSTEKNSYFYHFCNELFLQNNRVLFDGIENTLSKQNSEHNYCIEYWGQCRALNRFCMNCNNEKPSRAEQELFAALEKPDAGNGQYKVTERYRELLNKIVAMAEEKYKFEHIDIALITCMEDGLSNENGLPEISQLDIVSCALNSTPDTHFNKYTIKDKLVNALSQPNDLREYGYHISQHDTNGSAYFFICFDSTDNPIVPVYLYFSSLSLDKHGEFNLMLLLRDILSYRNRLLKILRNDFAGDIFPKYAHTSGEKSILAHEKATSHNTTGDDSVTLEIFMDQKATSKYSVLDSNQVLKWLLLHNYTNAQIAKLFNRSYRTNEEHDNSGNFLNPPQLYLKRVEKGSRNGLSWFEHPLQKFSDLRLLDDGRIALLDTVVLLKLDKIKNVSFIENDQHEFYNVEYFKNIFIDIIISAMKYSAVNAAYLERIDTYLEGANKLRHQELLTEENKNKLKKEQCQIECFVDRESTLHEKFDYLVIRNNVNKLAHNLFDWESNNRIINARLKNPIDYADGHMSILAISHYIENLWSKELHQKTKFEYVVRDGELVFETRLPIIKKNWSDINGKN